MDSQLGGGNHSMDGNDDGGAEDNVHREDSENLRSQYIGDNNDVDTDTRDDNTTSNGHELGDKNDTASFTSYHNSNRKRWSAEEDMQLLMLVEAHGSSQMSWNVIANKLTCFNHSLLWSSQNPANSTSNTENVNNSTSPDPTSMRTAAACLQRWHYLTKREQQRLQHQYQLAKTNNSSSISSELVSHGNHEQYHSGAGDGNSYDPSIQNQNQYYGYGNVEQEQMQERQSPNSSRGGARYVTMQQQQVPTSQVPYAYSNGIESDGRSLQCDSNRDASYTEPNRNQSVNTDEAYGDGGNADTSASRVITIGENNISGRKKRWSTPENRLLKEFVYNYQLNRLSQLSDLTDANANSNSASTGTAESGNSTNTADSNINSDIHSNSQVDMFNGLGVDWWYIARCMAAANPDAGAVFRSASACQQHWESLHVQQQQPQQQQQQQHRDSQHQGVSLELHRPQGSDISDMTVAPYFQNKSSGSGDNNSTSSRTYDQEIPYTIPPTEFSGSAEGDPHSFNAHLLGARGSPKHRTDNGVFGNPDNGDLGSEGMNQHKSMRCEPDRNIANDSVAPQYYMHSHGDNTRGTLEGNHSSLTNPGAAVSRSRGSANKKVKWSVEDDVMLQQSVQLYGNSGMESWANVAASLSGRRSGVACQQRYAKLMLRAKSAAESLNGSGRNDPQGHDQPGNKDTPGGTTSSGTSIGNSADALHTSNSTAVVSKKMRWTEAEQECLKRLVKEHGISTSSWSKISLGLAEEGRLHHAASNSVPNNLWNRTAASCHERWYVLCRRNSIMRKGTVRKAVEEFVAVAEKAARDTSNSILPVKGTTEGEQLVVSGDSGFERNGGDNAAVEQPQLYFLQSSQLRNGAGHNSGKGMHEVLAGGTYVANNVAPVYSGKHSWSEADDALLISLIEKHGCRNWPLVSANIPGRTTVACQKRWYSSLKHVSEKLNNKKQAPIRSGGSAGTRTNAGGVSMGTGQSETMHEGNALPSEDIPNVMESESALHSIDYFSEPSRDDQTMDTVNDGSIDEDPAHLTRGYRGWTPEENNALLHLINQFGTSHVAWDTIAARISSVGSSLVARSGSGDLGTASSGTKRTPMACAQHWYNRMRKELQVNTDAEYRRLLCDRDFSQHSQSLSADHLGQLNHSSSQAHHSQSMMDNEYLRLQNIDMEHHQIEQPNPIINSDSQGLGMEGTVVHPNQMGEGMPVELYGQEQRQESGDIATNQDVINNQRQHHTPSMHLQDEEHELMGAEARNMLDPLSHNRKRAREYGDQGDIDRHTKNGHEGALKHDVSSNHSFSRNPSESRMQNEMYMGHTGHQHPHELVQKRAPSQPQATTKKYKYWTEAENGRLRELVKIYGSSEWTKIAEGMPGRSVRGCQDHWYLLLYPDEKLKQQHQEQGQQLQHEAVVQDINRDYY